MAVGFGFSVSDIALAFQIIKESVQALDKKHGASAEFAALLLEIKCLEDGVDALDDVLEEGDLQPRESAALRRLIQACQKAADDFVNAIGKYRPHLDQQATGFRAKVRQVQWALCKKEDVARFRAELARHTTSINMLLLSIQTRKQMRNEASTSSSPATVQQSQNEHLSDMLSTLSVEHRHFFMMIMQQNDHLQQTVDDMKHLLLIERTMAPQMLLQNPVILLDPFGKLLPFHLDFVDSMECFLAVLKARFSKAGVSTAGLLKLDNAEFYVESTRHQTPVDLTRKWDRMWRPGEQYDMRMVFHRFACVPTTCPICQDLNEEEALNVVCRSCGLEYQNLPAIDPRSQNLEREQSGLEPIVVQGDEIPYLLQYPHRKPEWKIFRPDRESDDEILDEYRRIQIISQSADLLDRHFPTLLLIEDFVRFYDIVEAAPPTVCGYQEDIVAIGSRAKAYISDKHKGLPPFASFAQIEKHRATLNSVSRHLQREIDLLVRSMCADQETKHLVNHLRDNYSPEQLKGYFPAVLGKMMSLLEFSQSGTGKSKIYSREKVDGRFFTVRPK